MEENVVNKISEYLKKSRRNWWNKDYMELLVQKVWKITEPVSIIDFGCGIGFMGELLLPILPQGSIYTGVDIAENLLKEAEKSFENSGYETHFIEADLREYIPAQKYDIAICQTVLQHIPDPLEILKKMENAVKPKGIVICIEVSRDVSGAALYIDGLDYGKLNLLGIEQKLRRNDFDRTGKDFEVALKLPMFMEKIGLKKVDVRVNDFVQYVSPSKENYKSDLEAFMAGNYDNRMNEENMEQFISGMVNRGLSNEEAKHEFESRKMISDYLFDNEAGVHAVTANCMFIAYGYKE